MDTSLPSAPVCLEPHTTKSWGGGQVLFADEETEAQRTVTWARSLGFLNVFQSHVPGPSSSPGGQWDQEQVGEEGQWSELRGRFSDLWIPEAKQFQVRKWQQEGLEKSWHVYHCVPPKPTADVDDQLKPHLLLRQPQNPSQHSTPAAASRWRKWVLGTKPHKSPITI